MATIIKVYKLLRPHNYYKYYGYRSGFENCNSLTLHNVTSLSSRKVVEVSNKDKSKMSNEFNEKSKLDLKDLVDPKAYQAALDDFSKEEGDVSHNLEVRSNEVDYFYKLRDKRKQCSASDFIIKGFDVNNVVSLFCFVSECGNILPRKMTQLNWRFQKKISKMIKRARKLKLMPFLLR